MFKRKDSVLPLDPIYPATLKDLGYTFTENGQFVHAETGKFAEFYVTDNERANQVHKEAFHKCIRKEMLAQLATYGVKECYLTGPEGKDIQQEKPEGKHVAILATNLKVLKDKKNVIVVIGEHNQDLGVWAYRSLKKEGGITGGSVVGLVKQLATMDLEGVPSNVDATPGIIILNPGELIYSPAMNKTMGQDAWLARPKKNALEAANEIKSHSNRVAGHSKPEQHINTVLEHIIPQLTYVNTHFWIIGVIDGAASFIKFADAKLLHGKKIFTNRKVVAMAFMHPTHDLDEVESDNSRTELKSKGKSWILSGEVKDVRIRAPFVTTVTGNKRRIWSATSSLSKLKKEEDKSEHVINEASGRLGPDDEVDGGVKIPVVPKITIDTGMAEGTHSSLWNDPYGENKTPDGGSPLKSVGSSFAGNSLDQVLVGPVAEMEIVDKQDVDYSLSPVSCMTVSSGVDDHAEMIMPGVADSVIEWFVEMAKVKRPQIFEQKLPVTDSDVVFEL